MILFTVGYYVIGRLLFLLKADFDLPGSWWDDAYYIWDAGNTALLYGTIVSLLPNEKKKLVKPILYYSILILTWEIINPFTNLEVNNPLTVTLLFTILLIGVIIWSIRDARNQWLDLRR